MAEDWEPILAQYYNNALDEILKYQYGVISSKGNKGIDKPKQEKKHRIYDRVTSTVVCSLLPCK